MRLFVIFILCISQSVSGQDFNFHQFYATPIRANAAFAGSYDGNYRVASIIKNQWYGFSEKPLKSLAITGDLRLNVSPNNINGNYLGLGLLFATDKAQQLDVSSNQASLMLAYHAPLNRKTNTYLSIGFDFGVYQKSINYDKLFFQDQFDGLDAYTNATGELLPSNQKTKAELGTGVQFSTTVQEHNHLQIGIAAHKLTRPDLSFYSEFTNNDYVGLKSLKSNMQFDILANYAIRHKTFHTFSPRIHIVAQNPHLHTILGANYRYGFYSTKQTALHFGTYLVGAGDKDSFIKPTEINVQIGFEIQKFVLGIGYDFGLNQTIQYGGSTHSIEISISILGATDDSGFICPQF